MCITYIHLVQDFVLPSQNFHPPKPGEKLSLNILCMCLQSSEAILFKCENVCLWGWSSGFLSWKMIISMERNDNRWGIILSRVYYDHSFCVLIQSSWGRWKRWVTYKMLMSCRSKYCNSVTNIKPTMRSLRKTVTQAVLSQASQAVL